MYTENTVNAFLDALASAHPDMPFKDGVLLAQKVYKEVDWMREQGVSDPPLPEKDRPPHDWTPEVLGAWAGRQERVTDFLPDRKINAIKELAAKNAALTASNAALAADMATVKAQLGL